MSDVLEPAEIAVELRRYPAWSLVGEEIERTFDRGDFDGSIAFVNAVAAVANRLDHHPDISVSWKSVTLRTSSHDVNGISARDFALIAAIEGLETEAAGA